MDPLPALSRRERQIMDAVYSRGRATVRQVAQDLPDRPSPTAVRVMMVLLRDKGHLRASKNGRENIYRPTRPKEQAGRSALRQLLATFFGGSIGRAMATHLADGRAALSEEEIRQIQRLIRERRSKGD